MIAALTNHLWQSTLFVLAAWVVAAALRKNGAHIRHRVWVVASMKFLVPFSALMSLGTAIPSFTSAATTSGAAEIPGLSIAVEQVAQPFTDGVFFSSAPATLRPATDWTAIVIGGIWVCGFVVIALNRLRGWQRIRAAVRTSEPLSLASPIPVLSSSDFLEPGVIGVWRPRLLLPAGIERHLTTAQLDAVLTHELCHVQRRDNLTSAIHMVVEAAFWFHPLVWFVGARLVDERERACDEHVLRMCGEPRIYAESIVNVCKLYVESPLACVSGVGGSDLRKRVAAILVNRVGLQLSAARKVTLAIAAVLAIVMPLVAGVLIAPLGVLAEAQRAKADRKFDVASVKPCAPDAPPPPGRSGGAGQASPGYLNLSCQTLRQLVSRAYLFNQEDHLRNRDWGEQFLPEFSAFIRGGPSWAYSEKFTIEAKAEGVTEPDTLTGPMLRALLEDRFQLKTHRASEERLMYALTVAKNGFKIKPLGPGECWELQFEKGDSNGAPTMPPHDQNVPPCGYMAGNGWGSYQLIGVKLGDDGREGERFVDQLWRLLKRPVIDRTSLKGRYSFPLEFTPDDATPGTNGRCGGSPDCIARLAASGVSDARPETFKSGDTIFKALEKLGLKLAETKALAEYLVIDRAERPRPNDPVDDAAPPTRARGAGEMIAAVTNHVWQSTLFVLAAWIVAAALRKNGAHIRHRVWLVASIKFLVPFSLLMSLGAWLPRFAPAASTSVAADVPGLSIAVIRLRGWRRIRESILNACRFYVESPLTCVSDVGGSDLRRRVAAMAAIMAIALPIAAGMLTASASVADAASAFAQGLATADKSARFDVVSIKPCDPKVPFARRGDPAPRGFRAGGAPYQAYVSPGYVYWDCVTLAQLVDQAYVDRDHPLLNIVDQPRQNAIVNQPKRVRGGPAWVEIDKFAIEAKASLDVTSPGLTGSSSKYLPRLPEGMSQALRGALEDRFKLRVHRATEQQDMYALTIARGGLNKKTMLTPTPGDCATVAEYSAAAAAGNVLPYICGSGFSSLARGMEYRSFTLQQLAHDLSTQLDQFVLDRTGVDTKFNFVIKRESASPMSDGSSYSVALAALGLRLEPIKAPAEYLAIESAERPRPNAPAFAEATAGRPAATDMPARAQGAGQPGRSR